MKKIMIFVLSLSILLSVPVGCSGTQIEDGISLEYAQAAQNKQQSKKYHKKKNKKYTIPKNGGSFKSYTNYKLLNKKSPQWKKIQSIAYTDNNGLRKVDKYYCVAMGSFYSKKLGDTFKITTENGSFYIIICDFKDDDDTDNSNRYTKENGCITEFYVDNKKLSPKVKRMGSVSYASDKFKGKIKKIEKLENYFSIKQ